MSARTVGILSGSWQNGYPMYIHRISILKSAGFRIRVEPDLREAFIRACKDSDLSAAQVLRMYMRNYVQQSAEAKRSGLSSHLGLSESSDKGSSN